MTAGALVLALAAALPLTALGEDPPMKVLTWDDCVRLALAQNPDLSSSRFAQKAGVASYRGSWNGLMPNLTVSNSHNDDNTKTSASNKWSAQYSANINLFNASSIASIRSASASLQQAEANLRQASASLRFNLRQAFAQMLFAQKNFEVARNIRDMRDKDSQLVTLRYKSGRESKGNRLRAAAQLVQAEADLASARRNLRTAQKGLDRQMGIDDFQAVTATGTLDAAEAPESSGDSLYLAGRPDVAVSQAVVKSAQASMASAKSPLFPTLTGNYSRTRSGTYEVPATLYGWSGGFTLSLPLFGGGPTSVYYAVSGAKRSLEKARQDLRATLDAAMLDLETAWAGYAAAFDQVKVQHALLEAARQRNDEADVRYASGLLTYDNWEIIASDRISTEKQAISSEFNAVVAQASWEKSIGKGLGE